MQNKEERERKKWTTNHAKLNRNKYVSKSLHFDQRQIREDNRKGAILRLLLQFHRFGLGVARILRSGAWSVAHSVHVPYLLFFLEFAFYHSNCWRWNDVIFSFRGLKSKRKKKKYQTNKRNFLNNTFTADRQFIRSISFWSKRSAHTNNVRKECPVWIFAFGGLQRPTPFDTDVAANSFAVFHSNSVSGWAHACNF